MRQSAMRIMAQKIEGNGRVMSSKIIHKDIERIVNEHLKWSLLEGKSVLITGASGFLASYIVQTLLYLNDVHFKKKTKILALVRNIDNAKIKFERYISRDDLIFIYQDITIPFDINGSLDYIIHAASQASSRHFSRDPVGTLKANTVGTANLLDIARKKEIKKFLFFSSGEVYGMIDNTDSCVDESYNGNVNPLDVRSCYAESKRMGENMCVCWSYQYDVPVNIIRVGYTYGPGLPLSDDRVVADFVNKIVNNENLVLNSDGSAKRSFCYITDMVYGIFLILLKGKNREVYNAASSIQTSILDLANTLIELYPEKGLSIEIAENKLNKNYLKSQRKTTLVCTEKIKAYGWYPKIDIRTGLKRMIESYQK